MVSAFFDYPLVATTPFLCFVSCCQLFPSFSEHGKARRSRSGSI